MMTSASCTVGPSTNSAGPAVESHVEGSTTGTTVVSGGGATGTTVSFRAEAGGVRSHARTSIAVSTTIDSGILPVGLPATRGVFRGESHPMPPNLYSIVAPSIRWVSAMRLIRHPTYWVVDAFVLPSTAKSGNAHAPEH